MGADNTFKLKIVASNRVFYDGRAQTLVIPAIDGGEVGFLAQHENCVTPVEVGEMRIKDTQGKIILAFVGSGFLEFVNNEATLVCVSAELPNEIDARRAKEAKERAEEEMRQHHSQMEYHHSQANLARAMERLRVVKRYPR